MNMSERLWVTKENTYWPTFRNFVASDLDHGPEYPQYVRLDIVHRLLVALINQTDNVSFILNRVNLPDFWFDKFSEELDNDRNVIKQTKEILNEGSY